MSLCLHSPCTLPEFSRSVLLLPSLLFSESPSSLFLEDLSRRAHKYARISGDFSLRKKKTLYEWECPRGLRPNLTQKMDVKLRCIARKSPVYWGRFDFRVQEPPHFIHEISISLKIDIILGVDKSTQVNSPHYEIRMLIHLFYYKL